MSAPPSRPLGDRAPRAVVFDLDDTLADTAGTILERIERLAVEELLRQGLGSDLEEACRALREIRAEEPGAPFMERLLSRFGAPDPTAANLAARRIFFGTLPEGLCLVADALRLLRHLSERGIVLYLVTFGVREIQTKKLATLGIEEYFEEVFVAPLEEGSDKTEILREILDRTGGPRDRVWVVGDRPPGEIRSGNLLGTRTIRVRRGEFAALEPAGPEEEADVTVRSLSEIQSLLPPPG